MFLHYSEPFNVSPPPCAVCPVSTIFQLRNRRDRDQVTCLRSMKPGGMAAERTLVNTLDSTWWTFKRCEKLVIWWQLTFLPPVLTLSPLAALCHSMAPSRYRDPLHTYQHRVLRRLDVHIIAFLFLYSSEMHLRSHPFQPCKLASTLCLIYFCSLWKPPFSSLLRVFGYFRCHM